ncbi:unnamed protein product [Diamesa hyperborea]
MLPDIIDDVLILILVKLDTDSLLEITKTCRKLNNIFYSSELTKNVVFEIKFPDPLMGLDDFEAYLNNLMESKRNYRNLRISDLDEQLVNNASVRSVFNQVLEDHFYNHTKELELKSHCTTIDDYNQFISKFTKLKSLILTNLQMKRQTKYPINFTTLEKLHLKNDIWNDGLQNVDFFEELLMAQSANLKELCMQNFNDCRFFKTDRSEEVKFNLIKLKLDHIFFADNENALKFLQTQTILREVSINPKNEEDRRLDELNWYHDIFKYIFQLSTLQTLHISMKYYEVKDLTFLKNVVNFNVENLSFHRDRAVKNCSFFIELIRIFPNVRNLIYNGNVKGILRISSMKNLESLTLVESRDRLLKDLTISSTQFIGFNYYKTAPSQEIESCLINFMKRHPTIVHLKISVTTEIDIAAGIVDHLPNLKTLSIDSIYDLNNTVQFLCRKLVHLKSLTLQKTQYDNLDNITQELCQESRLNLSYVNYFVPC